MTDGFNPIVAYEKSVLESVAIKLEADDLIGVAAERLCNTNPMDQHPGRWWCSTHDWSTKDERYCSVGCEAAELTLDFAAQVVRRG